MDEDQLVAIITAILMAPTISVGSAVGTEGDTLIQKWVEKARAIVRVSKS